MNNKIVSIIVTSTLCLTASAAFADTNGITTSKDNLGCIAIGAGAACGSFKFANPDQTGAKIPTPNLMPDQGPIQQAMPVGYVGWTGITGDTDPRGVAGYAGAVINGVSIGNQASAGGAGAFAGGQNAKAMGSYSAVVGPGAAAMPNADYSIAYGYAALSQNKFGGAIGALSETTRDFEVAFGGSKIGTRILSGITAGQLPNDAVNREQLDANFESARQYTDAQVGVVDARVTALDSRVTAQDSRIDSAGRDARNALAGVAAAASMGTLPALSPGERGATVGMATYAGHRAIGAQIGYSSTTHSGIYSAGIAKSLNGGPSSTLVRAQGAFKF